MIKVNLLRPERKDVGGGEKSAYTLEEHEKKLNIPAIAGGIGVGLALIALLFFIQTKKFDDVTKEKSNKEMRRKDLEGVLQKLADAEAAKKAVDEKIRVIQELKIKQKSTVLAMDKVSRCIPDWLWLTSFTFNNNQIAIQGKAMSNSVITDFIGSLNNSNYFTNVYIKSSNRSKEGAQDLYIFELTCVFVRPADEINKAV